MSAGHALTDIKLLYDLHCVTHYHKLIYDLHYIVKAFKAFKATK